MNKKISFKNKEHKHLHDVLKWMHVQEITENGIYLKSGSKEMVTRGFNISPVSIFLMDQKEVVKRINRLSAGLNKIKFNIYQKFVKSTPRVDVQMGRLSEQLAIETNSARRKMIQVQLNKFDWIADTHTEVRFYEMVKADAEHIDKFYDELISVFQNAGFICTPMSTYDYETVIAETFKNETINQYMHSYCIVEEEEFLDETN